MTNSATVTPSSPFIKRYLFWSKDRFPVFNIVVAFVMAFSIKGLFISDTGFNWQLPDFLLGLLFLSHLFILRVMDEHKDYISDRSFHPDRAVQKGLIHLFELRYLAGGALGIQLLAIGMLTTVSLHVVYLWIFVWVWSLLMLKEFFIKEWLRKHLLVYSLLHLLISPLMFWTGWLFYSHLTQTFDFWKLALLVSLSFSTGLMFEIGRKNRSVEEDQKGEISFSSLWGRKKAGLIILQISFLALVLGAFYIRTGWISLGLYCVFSLLLFWSSVKALKSFHQFPNENLYKKCRQSVELMVVWSFVGSFLIVLIRSYL